MTSRRTECQVLAAYVGRALHGIWHAEHREHAHRGGNPVTSADWAAASAIVAEQFPELWADHTGHGCAQPGRP